MKASLAWLNSYLDRPCTAEEAQRDLTAAGFPVEEMEAVTLSAPPGTGGTPRSAAVDMRLDVEITSNRGDCLSHVGLAREVAAASQRQLRLPAFDEPASREGAEAVTTMTDVALEEPSLCPVYTARVISGVKVGPSPQWLVDRLTAAGLRSVNNVVDVTNFVLLELGQPLHAFDLNLLRGRRIVVRRAAKDEPFVAIDGTKHALRQDMLVIADADRPVAVAGVMGGRDSEVTEATTDVLLESAMFAPLSVRRTSRALKLASDSSYRFERGVDPLGIERASRRAAALIVELAGGTLAQGVIRAGEPEPELRQVSMRTARCSALLGVDLPAQQQADYLARLELSPCVDGGSITCTIPSFRNDLKREVDLIEEVARLHGFEQVEVQSKITLEVRSKQPAVAARQAMTRVLVAHGYHETVTFSFLSPRHGKPFVPAGGEAVVIDDERRKAEPMLRPSLLPSLLSCRKLNQDVGNDGVRLFETASTWTRQRDRIVETVKLGLLRDAEDASLAMRELRGAIEETVERLGGDAALRTLRIDASEGDIYAAAGTVKLGDQVVGSLGVIADPVRDLFDVKTPIVAAELLLEPLLALYPPSRQVGALPRFPGIERDLSVVVAEDVAWQRIEEVVRTTEPAMLEDLSFLGVYRGKPIEKGRKSVSLRMIFRDPAGTLRHEQVDPQVETVVGALREAVNAELRG